MWVCGCVRGVCVCVYVVCVCVCVGVWVGVCVVCVGVGVYSHLSVYLFFMCVYHMCHGAGSKVGWIKEYRRLTFTM